MTPAGPGRPRDPETDTAILRAAFELFLERGADGTSLEQVAKRAGVAKLTIYRRWGSKEDLLVAAVERNVQATDYASAFPTVEEARAVPLSELVERLLPRAVQSITAPEYPALIAQALGSATRYPALIKSYWEHHIRPRRHVVGIMLERARDEGRIRPDADLEVLIDMIVGALMYRVLQPGRFDQAEARRYLEAVYRQAGLIA